VHRVLITDSLSKAGLKVLEQTPGIEVVIRSGLTPQQVREELKSVDAIIIRSGTTLTAEILEGQERLKCIARAGVGVDNINLEAATRAGVLVMNTPSGNTISTAEHTFAMMLALSRNIGPAHASMKAGKWDRKSFQGTQLAGKTLAVLGLGRIGLSVAARARAFEMNVLGYDPLISEEKCKELGIQLFRDVDEIVTRCDYLTVHTPLTEETRGIINAERLAKMKKGVRIINCARGGIIDEQDLAAAIESGHSMCSSMNHPPIVGWSICPKCWPRRTWVLPLMKLRKWFPSKRPSWSWPTCSAMKSAVPSIWLPYPLRKWSNCSIT
jgi:D-3-phosphoglycerate dehydrogenase